MPLLIEAQWEDVILTVKMEETPLLKDKVNKIKILKFDK
jgi:hypothetical protein